jgi:hypothetical protein
MHPHDDPSIADHHQLIRGVRVEWWIPDADSWRLSSAVFKGRETSCFVSEEIGGLTGFNVDIRPLLECELESRLHGAALIAASDVRGLGFWIERRPAEFHGNSAHVVICADLATKRTQHDRAAKQLALRAEFVPR